MRKVLLAADMGNGSGMTGKIGTTEPTANKILRINGKNYTIIETFKGPNSTIHKATDDKGKTYAIKEIGLEHCKDEKGSWKPIDKIEREYSAGQNLNHPNLTAYREIHRDETERHYLVRDWAEGESLASLLERGVRFTDEQITQIVAQVLDAITYLHSLNPPIFHCDIKPGNIIVKMEEGKITSVKLIDLGSIPEDKETRNYVTTMTYIRGTPGFMPKETESSVQFDIFSVGATILFLKTGEDADAAYNARDALYDIPDKVNGNLRKVLEGSLIVATGKRFTSAEEMKNVLEGKEDVSLAQISNQTELTNVERWTENGVKLGVFSMAGSVILFAAGVTAASMAIPMGKIFMTFGIGGLIGGGIIYAITMAIGKILENRKNNARSLDEPKTAIDLRQEGKLKTMWRIISTDIDTLTPNEAEEFLELLGGQNAPLKGSIWNTGATRNKVARRAFSQTTKDEAIEKLVSGQVKTREGQGRLVDVILTDSTDPLEIARLLKEASLYPLLEIKVTEMLKIEGDRLIEIINSKKLREMSQITLIREIVQDYHVTCAKLEDLLKSKNLTSQDAKQELAQEIRKRKSTDHP